MSLLIVLGRVSIKPYPKEGPDSPLRMAETKETKEKNSKKKRLWFATGKRVIPHYRS